MRQPIGFGALEESSKSLFLLKIVSFKITFLSMTQFLCVKCSNFLFFFCKIFFCFYFGISFGRTYLYISAYILLFYLWASIPTFWSKWIGRQHCKTLFSITIRDSWGAWIAEWSSHSTLNIGTLHPGLWVRALVTSNSFSDPSTKSMLYSWFYLICLIWYYYLSVKFVMWIVKQKVENKRNLF